MDLVKCLPVCHNRINQQVLVLMNVIVTLFTESNSDQNLFWTTAPRTAEEEMNNHTQTESEGKSLFGAKLKVYIHFLNFKVVVFGFFALALIV